MASYPRQFRGPSVSAIGVQHRRVWSLQHHLNRWVKNINKYMEEHWSERDKSGSFQSYLEEVYDELKSRAWSWRASRRKTTIKFYDKGQLEYFLANEEVSPKEYQLRVNFDDGSKVKVVVTDLKPFEIEYDSSTGYATIYYYYRYDE